jgi:acetylornithine/succinyldiaminopimelate/putrescine aminotransferase
MLESTMTADRDPEALDYEAIIEQTAATELAVYSRMPLAPRSGRGCEIVDERGQTYLDLYGGHAVASTGHCHPRVVAAIKAQADELLFYSSAVFSGVRARANARLLAHAPHPDSRVFHCTSGSEANEVALKVARLATRRRQVIAFTDGFHGRTLGSLAACGIEKYRGTAGVSLGEDVTFVPLGDLAALEEAAGADTAAVLVEPIQSVGGMNMADDDWYRAVAKLCEGLGAALIFDEIQTGMGRTGGFFFGDNIGVKPDIITLAKGLASGVPAGACVVSPRFAAAARGGDQGSTFGGGPLAMSALEATVAVIDDERLCENAAAMGARLRAGVESIAGVVGIRGRGLLVGVELDRAAQPIQQALLERRIITGGSSRANMLRLLPPLTLAAEQLDHFLATLDEVLSVQGGE